MKIACVQMDISYGNPEINFAKVEKSIREAANHQADVVVLPEMWNTGYALDRLAELADHEGKRTKALLSELARELHIYIVGGSVSTKKGEHFFNTMYVADRSGRLIAEYDKVHLFKLMDEHHFLHAGQAKNTFEIDGITCGGVICYDLRFPEWTRAHVLEGAKVLFIPAEWPAQRIDHWQLLLQARAIENQCFIVAVNRVGEDPNNHFNGHSMVIAPWGDLLLSGNTQAGIDYAELDLKELNRVQKTIPIFRDRRTDLY